jgi:hypothetical protein
MKRLLVFVLAFLAIADGANALTRVRYDRPDDYRRLNQVHVIYAVPYNYSDHKLDSNGTISTAVSLAQQWFRSQTVTKKIRFDLYRGKLDITFMRLNPWPTDQNPWASTHIQNQIRALGFDNPKKVYLVFYDGPHSDGCGQGGPTTAVLFIGVDWCGDAAGLGPTAGYWHYVLNHEVLHSIGFVPSCAPNANGAHVDDSAWDIMACCTVDPWQFPPVLDVGNDDYFRTGRTDCPDLVNSPYLRRV